MKIKTKANLKCRGVGLKPDIIEDLELIAAYDDRKVNYLINVLLREAIAKRKKESKAYASLLSK